ncbi:MAG TPA: cation transporter, partial [Chitinophagaceae bacterium]|nr:cation transporter [Chitinophagaceae bacterium]
MEKQVDIQVGGMTCGNCALAVTNALKKLGAESAVANAATGEVSFTIVNEKNETEYYQEIKALGYSVSEKKHNVEENSPVVHEHYRVRNLFYISLALWVPLMLHMFLPFPILHQPLTQLVLCTPVYLICIYYFGSSAWRSIRTRIPNMDVLVFAGASAAYFYSLLGWYL